MTLKCCTKCKVEKNIECFNFKIKSENKRQSICAECSKQKNRIWYENPENKKKTLKRNEKNRKKSVNNNIKYYFKTYTEKWYFTFKKTLKCTECNENHPACLDFHHINKKEKIDAVANIAKKNDIKLLKDEILKCIVLCGNCHRKLHYNQKHNL